jgi:hypothetical protein
MNFHQQSFSARFGAMGDQAEGIFDLVHPKSHELGLNRPPFGMAGMSANMRYVPDRMRRDAFVEVMGFGRGQALKVKIEKFEALQSWQTIGPVELFIYDSHNHRYWEGPLDAWRWAFEGAETGEYEDNGKPYVTLPAENFPFEPSDAPDVRKD